MKQNKYPQCYKKGSHMATEKVLVTIRGENEEGKNNKGRARGGSHYVVTKKISISIKWNQKREINCGN